MRGPDPVRDREGIDIGFLECCRPGRVGATGPAMRARRPGTRAARDGAPDARIIPDERAWGGPDARSRRAEMAREAARTEPGDNAAARPGTVTPPRAPAPRVRDRRRGRRRARGRARRRSPTAAASRPRRTSRTFLFGWSFDPLVWLPAIVALLVWRFTGVGRVNRAHPAHPVAAPTGRCSGCSGVIASLSRSTPGIERYDTTLFSRPHGPAPAAHARRAAAPAVRRADHPPAPGVVARDPAALDPAGAPLAGRPAALVPGRRVGAVRRRHVGQPLLAAVRPRARERLDPPPGAPAVPDRGAAVLVAGRRPGPVAVEDASPAARVLYVGLQMPQNTFLALAIYLATAPLYAHYATNVRTWGPTPLEDQQLAGGIMWFAGDLVFLAMVIALIWAWMRAEERRNVGEDRRLEPERAAIREREATGGAARGRGGRRRGHRARVAAGLTALGVGRGASRLGRDRRCPPPVAPRIPPVAQDRANRSMRRSRRLGWSELRDRIQRRAPERPDRAVFGAICAIARNDAVRVECRYPSGGIGACRYSR